MLTNWQAHKDAVVVTLGRVGSALHELRAETQRTAAEHERMAAWYAQHGDEPAARMQRRTAASQHQLLADLDAAFHALQDTMSAALDQLDP
jgi:uncharacterized alpha-E superfamily protein